MTLQEAKDAVAKENGFKNWRDYQYWSSAGEKYHAQLDKAAELYARSKWYEAIEKVKSLNPYEDTTYAIDERELDALKPEFKP